ncbi:unnamed protein product [Diabrotica balteata]|uniref:Uncharacterized protein n=1 Tax=Diabrotica balteata TaxID=107213 RepID=A0A9N9T703_DIABA|nr:unnamed protein product [Diabrotica balteata]
MEFKVEAKEEFVECNQKYIESQSIDVEHLKNEPDECNSAMEVKPEIKKEFAQTTQEYIESQLSTSIDLGELKNENEVNSAIGQRAKIKDEFVENGQGDIENQQFTSLDPEHLNNESKEDNSGERNNKNIDVEGTYFYSFH